MRTGNTGVKYTREKEVIGHTQVQHIRPRLTIRLGKTNRHTNFPRDQTAPSPSGPAGPCLYTVYLGDAWPSKPAHSQQVGEVAGVWRREPKDSTSLPCSRWILQDLRRLRWTATGLMTFQIGNEHTSNLWDVTLNSKSLADNQTRLLGLYAVLGALHQLAWVWLWSDK